jgi:hypothetical protein
VAGQELIVERTDPLGDGPVEPPDLADQGSVHSLTLVREIARGQMRLARTLGGWLPGRLAARPAGCPHVRPSG